MPVTEADYSGINRNSDFAQRDIVSWLPKTSGDKREGRRGRLSWILVSDVAVERVYNALLYKVCSLP